MGRLIGKVSTKAYKGLAKPILFKQSPDAVHERLLKVGVSIQKLGFTRSVLRHSWAYRNQAFLGQEVAGIKFSNPVGLSAGFDKNIELPLLLKSIGFGFMEGGSITYEPCDGNPRPWFYRLPKTKSLVVFAGLANQGAKTIVDRIVNYPDLTFSNFPLNISVAKTNSKSASSEEDAINDYVGSLNLIKQEDVGDMITLNISCPNTYGGEPFTTPDRLDKLLNSVDKIKLSQPVFIKMPSDLAWDDFNQLLKIAAAHNVHGVTISNLAKDRGQVTLMDPLPDSVKGNLSGKPTWDLSNDLIRRTYLIYSDRFVIIGVGGIFSAEDAYTKIKLGATLVELITGMIFEGPQLIGQINRGLVKLLERDGYTNIHEAIGIEAK